MSGGQTVRILRNTAIGAAALMSANTAFANDNSGTAMTAGLIMEKMSVRERTSFISGIVDGLAHARFRKDTAAAGQNDMTGMNCIYDWLYTDSMATLDQIEAVFKKYTEHYPSTLVYVLVKKACGE